MASVKRKIRIMNLVLRDEDGLQWDHSLASLGRLEATAALEGADRVVVHVESERASREPASGEVAVLVKQVSEDGRTGPVQVSTYRAGRKTLLLISVMDRVD